MDSEREGTRMGVLEVGSEREDGSDRSMGFRWTDPNTSSGVPCR